MKDAGLPTKKEAIAPKKTTAMMTTAMTTRSAGFCQGLRGGA
jgi:hypothetical protein